MFKAEIQFDLQLDGNVEATLDGKKWVKAQFVTRSPNDKAPYICRRTDLRRSVMREYINIRSENMYTVVNGKKYRLVEVKETKLPI